MSVKLIVGLGNPGDRYEETRHNAGFWLVDELAARHGGAFRGEPKFHGDVCRVSIGGADVRLLKPQTYMNESGRAVQALRSFYKIGVDELLIAHDEIDLPPGVVKLKRGGGHGGHNGLRNLIEHLGKDFLRLRIGVGHPGRKDLVTDYVLKRPTRAEERQIRQTIEDGADAVPVLLSKGLQQATHRLHSKRPAREPVEQKTERDAAPARSKSVSAEPDGDERLTIREQLMRLLRGGGR